MNAEQILSAARTQAAHTLPGAQDGYPCGFAWVTIKPARGPFVKYLKDNGIGRLGVYGGWEVSSYDVCGWHGQNMDVKEDACRAFAEVLRDNGITARVESRMD